MCTYQSAADCGCSVGDRRPRRSSSRVAIWFVRWSRAVAPCLVPRQMHQRSSTASVLMMRCRISSRSAAWRNSSSTHSQSSVPGACDGTTGCRVLLFAFITAFSPSSVTCALRLPSYSRARGCASARANTRGCARGPLSPGAVLQATALARLPSRLEALPGEMMTSTGNEAGSDIGLSLHLSRRCRGTHDRGMV